MGIGFARSCCMSLRLPLTRTDRTAAPNDAASLGGPRVSVLRIADNRGNEVPAQPTTAPEQENDHPALNGRLRAFSPRVAEPKAEEPFNADDTLVHSESLRQRWTVRLIAVTTLFIYTFYLVYRFRFTINYSSPIFSFLVYFAEVHGFLSLYFFFHECWAPRTRRVVAPAENLSVDVFITTYNEDVGLLRQTLRAAVAMRYPHRTFVLDDGRRPAVRELAEEVGCLYITRTDNKHAKAGNWNNAFQQTDADLIASFDADHAPRADFLERTLGFFRDPKVALVQVPQNYHNVDSIQHRVSWRARRMYNEQDSFFQVMMPGKDHWNAAYFCGTGAVLRRTALEPYGGILTGTITEDLHTSIELHAAGWKSVYLNEVLVTGLAPADLRSFEVQRLRWAEGNLKVAALVNPLTIKGLTLWQRISYTASLYHWTLGLPKVIYYVAPAWMLLTGSFPIANYDRTFFSLYLTLLASLVVSYTVASRGKGNLFMDELYNMVSFFTLLRALKRVLMGRGAPLKFEVTSKKGSSGSDLRPVLPHLALILFSLLSISWSLLGLGFGVSDDIFGVGLAMFWTTYNMGLMILVIRLGMRPADKRAAARYYAAFAVEGRASFGDREILGLTSDISERGCQLLWPQPLPRYTRLPLRFHLGSHVVEWIGEAVGRPKRQADGWYSVGIRFEDLTRRDVDLLEDAIFTLAIPDLFVALGNPSWLVQTKRRLSRLLRHDNTRAVRAAGRAPLRVRCGDLCFLATVRDSSASGMGITAPDFLAVGTTVDLTVFGASSERSRSAVVSRAECRQSRLGFDSWVLGLRYTDGTAAALDASDKAEAA
jgi:cellulose synthase (UDP-forming)